MRRKAQEPPFHPGVTGEGNGRTGEGLEPLTECFVRVSLFRWIAPERSRTGRWKAAGAS
jgi:hypothetical protein